MKPSIEQITELQKEHGLEELQGYINNGMAWQLEGHVGRTAMQALESGACMLPEERHNDYYGNTVPSRNDLKSGTKGTLENSQNFWEQVLEGEIEMY